MTIVGKHCESGDVLVRDAQVPDDLAVGDVLATPVTGAYGHTNSRGAGRSGERLEGDVLGPSGLESYLPSRRRDNSGGRAGRGAPGTHLEG